MRTSGINFYKDYNSEICNLYLLAEEYCYDIPALALINLRSCVTLLLSEISKFYGFKIWGTPNEKIRKLDQYNIPTDIISSLDRVRLAGNQAAHPQDGSNHIEVEITIAALKDIYEATAWIYNQRISDSCTPNFKPPSKRHNLGKIYRDAFEYNDSQSQYAAGLMKIRQADRLYRDTWRQAKESGKKIIEANDIHALYQDAYYFFNMAYERNYHPEAMYQIGLAHLHGHWVDKDLKKAEGLIRHSANQGVADAQNQLGLFRLHGRLDEENRTYVDFEEALEMFEKASEKENLDALNNLMIMYRDGIGVQKDITRSIEYGQKAANAGYSSAQFNLGELYEKWLGVNANHQKAFSLYQEAARGGSIQAQIKLFQFYLHNDGVESDHEKAVICLKMLEEGDDPRSWYCLGNAYYKGLVVDKDLYKSASYLFKCIKYAYDTGITVSGKIYQSPYSIEELHLHEANSLISNIVIDFRKSLSDNFENMDNEKFADHLLLSAKFDRKGKVIKEAIDDPMGYGEKTLQLIMRFGQSIHNGTTLSKDDSLEMQRIMPSPSKILKMAVNQYRAIGRNDNCPCGSGKKYKKCCLKMQ